MPTPCGTQSRGRGVPAPQSEARLRWRLLENPARGEPSIGDCVRADDDGRIVGSTLHTPTRCRCGDAR